MAKMGRKHLIYTAIRPPVSPALGTTRKKSTLALPTLAMHTPKVWVITKKEYIPVPPPLLMNVQSIAPRVLSHDTKGEKISCTNIDREYTTY